VQDTLIVIHDLSSMQPIPLALVHRARGGASREFGRNITVSGGVIHAAGSGNHNVRKVDEHSLRDTSKCVFNVSRSPYQDITPFPLDWRSLDKVCGRFICGPESSVQSTLHGPEE
jgi:hypothetical protein